MKLITTTIFVIALLVACEWVALDRMVSDLRGELTTTSAIVTPEAASNFKLSTDYQLTTQHLQPAYNTLGRTITTQDLQ